MINELTGLSVDGLNRALASRSLSIRYDFRLVDELSAVWSLNGGAVINRSRSFDLDGGTWKLTLTLLKARIPAGLTVAQYQQVQVDRGIGDGLWAYFRGVIQEVRESTTRRGGSIVETLEVVCEGVLSKLKGNYVPRLTIDPSQTSRFHPMIGIARTIQYKHPASSVSASDKWQLAGNSHMYLRESGGSGSPDTNVLTSMQVSSDANFSVLYVNGPSDDYHAVTNVFPYEIHWKKALSGNFYIRYRVVDRWILPKVRPTNLATGTATQTISLPAGYYLAKFGGLGTMTLSGGPNGTYSTGVVVEFNLTVTTSVTFTFSTSPVTTFEVINARGREPYFLCNRRDPQNLLPTTIGSVNVASRFITPTDAASYITGVSDLGGTEPGLPASGWSNKEYLTVTFSDGAERTVEITAINRSTGQMTVDVFPTHPTLGTNAAAGDRIRVSTLEAVQAFSGRRNAAIGELTSAATTITGLRPQCAGIYYQIGQVLPFTGHRSSAFPDDKFWLSTSHVILNKDAQDYDAWDITETGISTIDSSTSTVSGYTVSNNVEQFIAIATSKQFADSPLDYDSDWILENTGIVSKDRTASGVYLDEMVKDWMAASFPPNVLLRDRPDGKVKIGPVTQTTAPAYVLPGVAQVSVQDRAERITNMTVIAVDDQGDPSDVASITFGGVSSVGGVKTWTNPERAFDGDDTTKATPVDIGGDVESFLNTMWFTIPPMNPIEAYPIIEKIRIAGQGLIVALLYSSGTTPLQNLEQSTLLNGATWFMLPSADWIALQNNQPFEIDGKDLARLIRPSRYSYIAISVRQWTDTVNGGISSIEILQRKVNAHTATMTDNSNIASNATLNSAGFGTTWSQPDGNLNMSFRYAPTAWMKRNSATYGQMTNQVVITSRGTGYTSAPTVSLSDGVNTDTATAELSGGRVSRMFTSSSPNRGFTSIPTVTFTGGSPTTAATAQAHIARGRTKIIRLGNMPQAECRTYAENYMDEYLRSHLVYTVEAPLLDYAEPGDTVLVNLPDGTQKNLLLWGISDSGGPGDNMATYELRDYSL
jgi:hypothetical protein